MLDIGGYKYLLNHIESFAAKLEASSDLRKGLEDIHTSFGTSFKVPG